MTLFTIGIANKSCQKCTRDVMALSGGSVTESFHRQLRSLFVGHGNYLKLSLFSFSFDRRSAAINENMEWHLKLRTRCAMSRVYYFSGARKWIYCCTLHSRASTSETAGREITGNNLRHLHLLCVVGGVCVRASASVSECVNVLWKCYSAPPNIPTICTVCFGYDY